MQVDNPPTFRNECNRRLGLLAYFFPTRQGMKPAHFPVVLFFGLGRANKATGLLVVQNKLVIIVLSPERADNCAKGERCIFLALLGNLLQHRRQRFGGKVHRFVIDAKMYALYALQIDAVVAQIDSLN